MTRKLYYLIGLPGTGKKTIAKEMCALHENLRLVDNHLINNPVFQVVDVNEKKNQYGKQIWDNITKIWEVVFDSIHEHIPLITNI